MKKFLEKLKDFSFSDLDLSRLLDLDYLTMKRPPSEFLYLEVLYLVSIVCIIISIIVFIVTPKILKDCPPKSKFIRKVTLIVVVNSILLALYNVIRSEGVSFLSMRLFGMIILIAYFVIVVLSIIHWIVFIPRRLEKFKNARLRDKYMRRKKR